MRSSIAMKVVLTGRYPEPADDRSAARDAVHPESGVLNGYKTCNINKTG